MKTLDGGDEPRPFRILSLDGGGIRGAFIAGFLAVVEKQTGRSIGEHFDLIAGTSTGGIIAAAVAFREPAARIEQFYRDRGTLIFRRWWEQPAGRWRRFWRWIYRRPAWVVDLGLKRIELDYSWLWNSKYAATELEAAMQEVFHHRPLGEARNRLVIPSVNMTNGQTKVFKTPHLPNHFVDRHLRVVDAVLATTAAPTYFPHAVIQNGSRYVDGGVWANNPGMVAITESIRISKECRRPDVDPKFGLDNTHMLSIGTGSSTFFADPPAQGAGVAWWGSRLIDLISISQSQGVHFQAKGILADRYERVDFAIPDGSWKLDSVNLVEQMIHNGRQRAAEVLATIRPRFFEATVAPYRPFPEAEAITA